MVTMPSRVQYAQPTFTSLASPTEGDDVILSLLLSQDLKFSVHTHPTLSEVLDELIKTSHVEAPAQKRPEPKVLDPKLKDLQPLPA